MAGQPELPRAAEDREADSGCEEAVCHLRRRIGEGESWYVALLEAIGIWRLPEETRDERCYRYLIGGEAFDWLLLAERLTETLDGAIPENEREALLFFGLPPVDMDDADFREAIGNAKHKGHLNYLYGVVVEEALQLAVEEEVHKERRSHAGGRGESVDDAVFKRIYGKGWQELLERFREECSLPGGDSISYGDWKAFTYWLFKYRVNNCDKARVASDTRKALLQVSRLEETKQRRLKRRRPAVKG